MASHGIAFTLNDEMYTRLLAEQKRKGKTGLSPDTFAKVLLCDLLTPTGKSGN